MRNPQPYRPQNVFSQKLCHKNVLQKVLRPCPRADATLTLAGLTLTLLGLTLTLTGLTRTLVALTLTLIGLTLTLVALTLTLAGLTLISYLGGTNAI